MTLAADSLIAPFARTPFGQIQRVRHETRRRTLKVHMVEQLTPGMRRITLQSAGLADFVSLSPDDHVKLFFAGSDGVQVMRDYTPRSFDNRTGELVIDFALHGVAGPATLWAQTAQRGDALEIGGPRGSAILPDVFDWYLLVGDETALPAIGRRLEELRPTAEVRTIVVLNQSADRQTIKTAATWRAEWIYRDVDGRDDVANVLTRLAYGLPKDGEGFVWIAGEARFAKALRAHLIEAGHPASQMKAAGYWVQGSAGAALSLD